MKRRVSMLYTASLLLVDMAMVALAFLAAYYARRATELIPAVNIAPFREYWGMLVIQIITMLMVFFLYRLYHLKLGASYFNQLKTIFAAISVGTIVTAAFTSLVFKNELDYPRLMVGYAWLLTILLVSAGRLALGVAERRLRERGTMAQRVIIVGGGPMAQRVLDRVQRAPELGYRVVGFVADGVPAGNIKGLPVLGPTDQIGAIVDQVYPDEVIIALPSASHQEILSLISRCEKGGVSIKVFPDVFQALASEVSIDMVAGLPLLTVRDIALRGWKLALKRAVDLVISTVALVMLSPLMLLVALLIRLDSSGPIFFVQERMGLDTRPFPIVKFRSMRADAEEKGPGWTVRDDPRRTRLGRLIRRLSIDELPQLINVLLGDMSLVGPRAEQPAFVEQFKQVVPRYMERHKEKAGLTGWAQVNGLRGDTSIAERTKFDLYYIENWSLWLDFKIMLKTIPRLIKDDNAY